MDPSADQITLVTTKVGIDATRSLTKPKENFERIRIPSEEKTDTDDYVEKHLS